jgi:hypothetical protein
MIKKYKLLPLNFKKFKEGKLVVNILGEYAFLKDNELHKLIDGKEENEGVLIKFAFNNKLQLDKIIGKYRHNKRF